MGGYDTITDFLSAHKGEGFDDLGKLFGAAEGEATRVLVDLGLTEEGQTLKVWLDSLGTHTYEITGTLTAVDGQGKTFTVTNATINADGTLTGVDGDGKTFTATNVTANADGTLTGVDGNGNTFTVTNATVNANGTLSVVDGGGKTYIVQNADAVVKARIELSGLDQQALTNWSKANGGKIDLTQSVEAEIGIAFGADWKTDLQSAWEIGKVQLYDGNGLPIEADPSVPIEKKIGPDSIFVGRDEDGTYHVIVTPEIGTKESVENTTKNLDTGRKDVFGVEFNSTKDDIDATVKSLETLDTKTDDYFGSASEKTAAYVDPLANFLNTYDGDMGGIADVIASTTEALKNGEITQEEADAILDPILKLAEYADQYLGVGNDISAGIAQGLTAYGWTTDASTLVTDIETALRGAAESHSPAQRFKPLGLDIAAGIGVGLRGYSYAVDAALSAAGMSTALSAALEAMDFKATGSKYGGQLMDGIDTGLENKRSTVVSTARSIANEIKRVIREAWDINSPSKEGQWLSEMLMKGLEIPMERELPDFIGMLDALELRTSNARANVATGGLQHVINHNERFGSVSMVIQKAEISSNMDINQIGEDLAEAGNRVNAGMGG